MNIGPPPIIEFVTPLVHSFAAVRRTKTRTELLVEPGLKDAMFCYGHVQISSIYSFSFLEPFSLGLLLKIRLLIRHPKEEI